MLDSVSFLIQQNYYDFFSVVILCTRDCGTNMIMSTGNGQCVFEVQILSYDRCINRKCLVITCASFSVGIDRKISTDGHEIVIHGFCVKVRWFCSFSAD